MDKRNIIVIGASAGGFDALKQLVANLPKELPAAIFIVWHMAPDAYGVLPQVFNQQNTIYAAHAIDNEPVKMNRIYVAPPDHHLLLEKGMIRVSRGPKENRFRPAVDPLFRSAAYEYGTRVIGVVLSGALDDGTSGLWTIKQRGGIAVVQDPLDAAVPSMPENALREVEVDYQVPVMEMAALFEKLCNEENTTEVMELPMDHDRIQAEIQIAMQDGALERGVMKFGEPTMYTCPECHGVLMALKDGNRVRFRCHTGHAFSSDSLLAALTESIEDSFWNSIRAVEESMILLNHLGDHFAESNQPRQAARYFKKAKEAQQRIQLVRQAVLNHEKLSADSINHELENDPKEDLLS